MASKGADGGMEFGISDLEFQSTVNSIILLVH